MSPLPQDQLDFFSRHGYLVLEKIFTANELRDEFEDSFQAPR